MVSAMTENNKPKWFEEFAAALQKDLLALRDDMREGFSKMATKQDLADLRAEMFATFATHSELQSVEDRLLEEIGKIKYAKEIDELRFRMNRVEGELGIGTGGSLA